MAGTGRKRKVFAVLGIVVVLIVVFIALLPTFISAGLGHGQVRSAMQRQIDGSVDFASLRVRWFGPQEMTQLRIRDAHGDEAANLNLSADLSLLGAIFGGIDAIELSADGTLRGTLYQDGSTSFQRLIKTDPGKKPPEPDVINLEGLPPLRVQLDLSRIDLHDQASGRDIVLRDVTSGFGFEPGGMMSLTLNAAVSGQRTAIGSRQADASRESIGERAGTINLTAQGDQLFDSRGRFTPGRGTIDLTLEASGLPIVGLEQPGEISRLVMTARAAPLTDRLVLELNADAQIESDRPSAAGEAAAESQLSADSHVVGAITIASLFREDGRLDFRLENLSGSVSGERVPSSIVQPFLAATPIVLARDAGPTVDVQADFVAGDETTAGVLARGAQHNARLEVDATYNLNTGAWRGSRLVIASDRAHPDLIEGYTGMRVREPTDVVIELTDFGLPPIDETAQKRPLAEYAATGSITAGGPVLLMLGEETSERGFIRLEQASVELESARLRDGLRVRGSANVEGGQLNFDERITNLFDDAGELVAARARPVGMLTIENAPSDVLVELMPNQRELLSEALGQRINAELVTRVVDDELEALLSIGADALTANATMRHQPEQVRVMEARAEATVSPRLAAIAQQGQEQPIELLAPARVSIDVQPLTVRLTDGFTPHLPGDSDAPIRATVRIPQMAAAGIGALAEPVALRDLSADVSILTSEPPTYDAQVTGAVHRHDGAARVANLTGTMHLEPGEAETTYRGEVTLGAISVRDLESLLGRDHDSLAQLIGDGGDVTAAFSGRGDEATGTITSAMQRLAGQFDMSLDADRFSLTTEQADVALHPKLVERAINRDPEAPVAIVEADLPVQLRINALYVPRTVLFGADSPNGGRDQGAARGLGDVAVDAVLTGGPGRLRHARASEDQTQQTRVTLSDLRIEFTSAALRDGVRFDITGLAAHDADAPGEVRIAGAVADLFDEQGELSMATARLDLDANVTRAPTMLIDGLLAMNGYLHAAAGPEGNATVTTRNFSTNSGSVDVDITTVNGFVRGRGTSHDGRLHGDSAAPIEAQLDLNPLLRQMLLSRLHPLLGDVVSAAQPLRATMSNATLPLTGDVSGLNGDVEITLGQVQFDRRSEMLVMLALARVTDTPRLDGSIDPIRARIRNGVIEYDQFNVNIGQLSLPYSGRIDLNTGHVELRTNTKLSSLATAFMPGKVADALGGRAGNIIRELDVPIVYSGRFGELKPRIDPAFKIEEKVARILAESLLMENVPKLPDLPVPFPPKDLLDEIFNRNRSGGNESR